MYADKSGLLVQVLASVILGVEQLCPGLCSNFNIYRAKKLQQEKWELRTTSCSVAKE